MTRKLADVAVDVNTGDILYRQFVIAQWSEGWDWVHEDDIMRHRSHQRGGFSNTLGYAIAAIDAWHEKQAAA